jgi:hypothetical protein
MERELQVLWLWVYSGLLNLMVYEKYEEIYFSVLSFRMLFDVEYTERYLSPFFRMHGVSDLQFELLVIFSSVSFLAIIHNLDNANE